MTTVWPVGTAMAVLAAGLATAPSAAADIIFNDFSNTGVLTVNGSAATTTTADGTVMRLTPAVADRGGSVFSTAKVSTAEFTSVFSFRITENDGPIFDGNYKSGADGLVFVVQNQANNVGSIGQGIGYQGIAPSLGVEFDTWHNSVNGDLSQSHVGININGNVNHNVPGQGPTFNVGDSPFGNADLSGPELDDGDRWWAWVLNDGHRVDVFLEQNESSVEPMLPTSPILSFDVDLASILGDTTAFAGFTSATGADWSNHDLIYWRYTEAIDVAQTTSVPEPSSICLMLIGTIFVLRRIRRSESFSTFR